ncbi:hypothetical protein B9057_06060 [Aestuarium zhoushanense]|nr:hypothetical protein B9057_02555 [Aestuarium zhoushanense]AUJ63902.1 hypothetical protein B9057_06060 [Aestuarium zhoushanense]
MEWSGGLELKPRGDFGERVPLSDERARAIHNFRSKERLLTDFERAHFHLNAVISSGKPVWSEQYLTQRRSIVAIIEKKKVSAVGATETLDRNAGPDCIVS